MRQAGGVAAAVAMAGGRRGSEEERCGDDDCFSRWRESVPKEAEMGTRVSLQATLPVPNLQAADQLPRLSAPELSSHFSPLPATRHSASPGLNRRAPATPGAERIAISRCAPQSAYSTLLPSRACSQHHPELNLCRLGILSRRGQTVHLTSSYLQLSRIHLFTTQGARLARHLASRQASVKTSQSGSRRPNFPLLQEMIVRLPI